MKRPRIPRSARRPAAEAAYNPDETPAACMAMRLKLAIYSARMCTDRECRRRDMCPHPALDCKQRHLADAHDWDHGWFNSQRKPMYGVPEDSWMPAIRGGTPEFRAQQQREWMEDRASLQSKLNPEAEPE